MPKTTTLKDVASQAGVSYQTVSKVLNGKANVTPETESRIWDAVEMLGYKPNVSARNLRTQSSHLIGYAWRALDENRPVLDRFLYKAAQTAEEHGYHLLTFLIGSDDLMDTQTYQAMYDRRQVDGFLLADTNQNDPRIAYLIEQGIPFTSFGQANKNWDFCWVDVDGQDGIEQVVDHLLERGHQRIAMLGWPAESQTGQHREAGYRSKMKEAGLPLETEWMVRVDNTVQAGAEGVRQLLALPTDKHPTAVVCISDVIAIGAMNGLAAAGLQVGQDIAVTGYDDIPMSEFLHPPLTTVRQPITAVGQAVVDLLLKQINNQSIEQKGILLKPRLVVRRSSGVMRL
ncbi:MAG: LacI family DNA-binding transcriptional regulator [Ardenticatenaceae bacterium]|nr:LacI family DNA-binding transcriptional regulator [Ardenticatenaceae bacterium]